MKPGILREKVICLTTLLLKNLPHQDVTYERVIALKRRHDTMRRRSIDRGHAAEILLRPIVENMLERDVENGIKLYDSFEKQCADVSGPVRDNYATSLAYLLSELPQDQIPSRSEALRPLQEQMRGTAYDRMTVSRSWALGKMSPSEITVERENELWKRLQGMERGEYHDSTIENMSIALEQSTAMPQYLILQRCGQLEGMYKTMEDNSLRESTRQHIKGAREAFTMMNPRNSAGRSGLPLRQEDRVGIGYSIRGFKRVKSTIADDVVPFRGR